MRCCHLWAWRQFLKSSRLSHQSTRRRPITLQIILPTRVFNQRSMELGKSLTKSLQGSCLTMSNFRAKAKRSQALSVVQVQVTNIQPKENVVYTKQTQTTNSGTQHERDGEKLFCTHIHDSAFNKFMKIPLLKTPIVESCNNELA